MFSTDSDITKLITFFLKNDSLSENFFIIQILSKFFNPAIILIIIYQ